MGWFSVTTNIKAGNGSNVVFAFRTRDIETLDELADELAENGVVVGERFRVANPRRGLPGVLDDRREIMLTREGIASAVVFYNAHEYELHE